MRPDFVAIILAGERGTGLLGKSPFRLALECVERANPRRIYVATSVRDAELRTEAVSMGADVRFLGDFFKRVLKKEEKSDILVLRDNLPLLLPETLRALVAWHRKKRNSVSVLGASVDGGVCVFRGRNLAEVLDAISTPSWHDFACLAKSLEILDEKRATTGSFRSYRPEELLQSDSPARFAEACRVLRDRKLGRLLAAGVSIRDLLTTWIDLDVRIGRGTTIYPSVIIEGKSRIGRRCQIYPFAHLINCVVGDDVKIFSSSVIEDSVIEDEAWVGPFSRLRPKAHLRARARVGNFVEMKNTRFGRDSKAMHLSYLGDSDIDAGVNIGAGTITCNFDGFKKHRTKIASGAFIGSGSELVAPVKVGRGAYVGAGSTITKNVSPGALAVARGRQIERRGWAARKKRKK